MVSKYLSDHPSGNLPHIFLDITSSKQIIIHVIAWRARGTGSGDWRSGGTRIGRGRRINRSVQSGSAWCVVRARGHPTQEEETEMPLQDMLENSRKAARKIEKSVGAAGVDQTPKLLNIQILCACHKLS